MLQVRNLPDEVHERLKQRAAEERMSLSDYVARELTKMVRYRSNAEILEEARRRARERGTSVSHEQIVSAIHEGREGR
jgi:plasmid stability protein